VVLAVLLCAGVAVALEIANAEFPQKAQDRTALRGPVTALAEDLSKLCGTTRSEITLAAEYCRVGGCDFARRRG
jgi:hypothetical protein